MYRHGYVHDRLLLAVHSVADLLVFSSVYLSLASCAMMYIAGILQAVPVSPALYAIGFCITFSIYNLNRRSDEAEDQINHVNRYAFTKRYEESLLVLAVAAYGIALALAWVHGGVAVLVTAFPLIAGVLYSFPFLPESARYRRLKDIPVAKNLTISVAWTVPHALLPAVVAGTGFTEMTSATSLFFFGLVFINTVLFDMRDVEGDAALGVRTVPVILGIPSTTRLLVATGLIFGAIILNISIPIIPLWQSAVLALGTCYGIGYVISFQGADFGHSLCDLLADGQFILIGGALFLCGFVCTGRLGI
jgi:4-hydroxybenzoate polyprenyltransferase